tara:strand:+ start:2587 stop:3378 length:792 start_codon:yes stop_codon:yes gene_type:complete
MTRKLQILSGMNGDLKADLIDSLRMMRTRWGVSGLKLSTEDAAMSLSQIDYWICLCRDLLPVVVKIGGPNARNDIRQLVHLNVDGLIAPMVESSFGLENFIEALRDYTTPLRFKALGKQINIETETAAIQLDSILSSPSAGFVDEITIGRKDLSRSMGLQVEDPKIEVVVAEIVKKVQSKSINISIGGGIVPKTVDSTIRAHSPDQFNTRILTFQVDSRQSYFEAVRSALEFEIMALKNDTFRGFISREEEKSRTKELMKRLK